METVLTPEGEEFLGYARQVTDQYQLLENRYIYRTKGKKKFQRVDDSITVFARKGVCGSW